MPVGEQEWHQGHEGSEAYNTQRQERPEDHIASRVSRVAHLQRVKRQQAENGHEHTGHAKKANRSHFSVFETRSAPQPWCRRRQQTAAQSPNILIRRPERIARAPHHKAAHDREPYGPSRQSRRARLHRSRLRAGDAGPAKPSSSVRPPTLCRIRCPTHCGLCQTIECSRTPTRLGIQRPKIVMG